jgi:hypothetical protein
MGKIPLRGPISPEIEAGMNEPHFFDWTPGQATKEPSAVVERDFQGRVGEWMGACFTPEIIADKLERADRFIEEALELVQATGYSADRAHALVDYVFNRPVGVAFQEVGGVMVTLAALCNPHDINMDGAAETELARVWTKIDKIREKHASKPVGSALPVPVERGDHDTAEPGESEVERLGAFLAESDPEGCDEEWSYLPQAEALLAILKRHGLSLTSLPRESVAETVERCAFVAETTAPGENEAYSRQAAWGYDQARQAIAAAIRALTPVTEEPDHG